ncbi:hypothetical protein H6P81_003405 [Aristolochia fimbriata]|uniref:BZIP domain-containing protein n=1 Tax=Aristolochia fimbriata TaxID=158543 RepID=A0AAV7FGK0_ARIFI|nr:hypothetical protein H6P81_003405 [Aristolochia fimbriata]
MVERDEEKCISTAIRLFIFKLMENSKGTAAYSRAFTGKQYLLPPKSPFPTVPPSYPDYGTGSSIGSKAIVKSNGYRAHQRTSSESFLIEEQPSWLDDLLNEPETPVRRPGHRRSSSDSFAYIEASNSANLCQEEFNCGLTSVPSWRSLDFEHFREIQQASLRAEANSFERQTNRGREHCLNSGSYYGILPSSKDRNALQGAGLPCSTGDLDVLPSTSSEKQVQEESSSRDGKVSERRDGSHVKSSASEADPKRAKQQFAQRSRVRKLQYIAELERNVQALQAEGSEAAAELEFLDRQNLILSMENKALKQRLDSLAQEQLIKYLEQEMLEREIARLRALLYQQQQPQPPLQQSQLKQQQQHHSNHHHRRSSSRDLDSQFANLSLKQESSSGRDSVNGPLHI